MGILTWGSTDLDSAVSEDGVVHQSVTSTSHNNASNLKQGYDYANFGEITPDPIACYPMDELEASTANDVAGSYDASIDAGNPTLGANGVLGTGAHGWDGDEDYSAATDAAWNTDGRTYTAWVYVTNALSGNWRAIMRRVVGGTYEGLQVTPEDDYRIIYTNSDGGWSVVQTPANINEWGFLAGVFYPSTNTIELYVNGASVGTANLSGIPADSTNPVRIGRGNPFDGRVGELRRYDVGLTASQVQTLYDVVDTPGSLITAGKVS